METAIKKIHVIRPSVEDGNVFPPRIGDPFPSDGRWWVVEQVTHKVSLKTGQVCYLVSLKRTDRTTR